MTAGAPGAGRRRAAKAGPPEESPDSAGQGARAGRCGIPAANAGKGKCHRNQTATGPQGPAARVKRRCKRPPCGGREVPRKANPARSKAK